MKFCYLVLLLLLSGLMMASSGWAQSCDTLGSPPALPTSTSPPPPLPLGSGTPPALPTPNCSDPKPADGVSGVVSAYSTRQLLSAYAGPAIRVKRSSDNAQQDIGFAAGELDTAALSAFVGGGDGYVVTIYDQSGHGNHLTVGGGYNPGMIVTAGTITTTNGKPALYFDASHETYANSNITPNTGNSLEVFVVWSFGNSTDTFARPISMNDGTLRDWNHMAGFDISRQNGAFSTLERNSSKATINQAPNTLIREYGVFGPATHMLTDGTQNANGNAYGNFSISHLAVAGYYDSGSLYSDQTPVGGYWAECIVTNTNQGDYTTFFNNQASYWGTP